MTGARRLFALILIAGVFVMDGYDLNAMPLAVPRLADPLGLDPADFGVVFAAPMIGLGIGGLVFAPLGDRFGRRILIVGGCLLVSLVTWLTTHATTVSWFVVWRFLTGLFLGAALPNCTALSAELAPPRLRATIMMLVSTGLIFGALSAGLSAPALDRAMGWQGLLYTPAILALVVAVMLWFILPGGAPKAEAATPRKAGLPQIELLRRPWLFPFAIFAIALTMNSLNLYLITSWSPTLLPQAGFTKDQASYVTGLMQGVGLPIGLAMSVLIDRWKPGATLVTAFALNTALFAAVLLTPPDPGLWTGLLLAGAGIVTALGMSLAAIAAYAFPSRLLSSAMGAGVFIARIGAIVGPMIGATMMRAGASPGTILGIVALPAAIGALACLWVPAGLRVKGWVEAETAARA